MAFPSTMNEGGCLCESVSAKRPSRLRAALIATLSLLLRDRNVKKTSGHHQTQPFNRPDGRCLNNRLPAVAQQPQPPQARVAFFEFMDGRFGTALIPGLLSKICPRNCPNQAYICFITDSGPVPGVGD